MSQLIMLLPLLILPLLSEGRKFATQSPECGPMEVNSPSGVITSPGYPNPYPELISCTWLIFYAAESILTVRLTDLDIEEDPKCEVSPCCTDNWFSIASTKLCGSNATLPTPFSAMRKVSPIKFHTSQAIQGGRGFRLVYLVCRADESPCTDNLSCYDASMRCDGIPQCHDESDEWECPRDMGKAATMVLDECSGENMVPCGGTDTGCYNNVTGRCNSLADCPNMGADELNCGPCGASKLYCKSGGCYPLWGSCDNIIHCAGGWDEGERAGCGACEIDHVPCGPRDPCHCYAALTQRCDGQMDCPHGEDEVSCVVGCEDKIACASVQGCYSPSERCDGVAACLDSSDEVGCYSQSLPEKFRCSSTGRCVDDMSICNGEPDCEDGSDENDCMKNSIVTVLVMGSLSCGLLAVLCIACGWRYFSRSRPVTLSSGGAGGYQRQLEQGPLDEGCLYHLYREPPPSYHEAVLQGAAQPLYCHSTRYMNMSSRGESSVPVASSRRQRSRTCSTRPRNSRLIPKPQQPIIKPCEETSNSIAAEIIASDQLYQESNTSSDGDTPMLELSDSNVNENPESSRSPSGTSCSSLLSCESQNGYQPQS